MTEREHLERALAAEINAVNEIARDLAEQASLLSRTQEEQSILQKYIRIRGLMEDLTRRYEWSRYAGISLSVHKKMYR